MVFPILGANTEAAAYDVSNSIRWRPAGNGQMSQGNGTPTSQKIWTWSAWVKTAKNFIVNAETTLYSASGSGGNGANITFSNNALKFQSDSGSSGTDFGVFAGNPARQFRDPSAWYHIVCAMDSTQGTAANRNRIYVNGVEQTLLSGQTNATQNDDYDFCSNRDSAIGKNITSDGNYFDGYMSEIHLIDGQQLTASDFGKFEATSGVWVPIEYKGTFGNNGWYIPGSSNTADSSGNGNNFGQSNTVVTTDTPTNNFCVLNPLNMRPTSALPTYSEGNLKVTSGNVNQNNSVCGTIAGLKSGKWYFEVKMTTIGGTGTMRVGIEDTDSHARDGAWNDFASYYAVNGTYNRGSTVITSSLTAVSAGDIISTAFDLDNGAIYFAVNGTWQTSGDPTSGASKTGAAFTDILSGMPVDGYMPVWVQLGHLTQEVVEANFGNPPFSISSGNADDNGYGNFEYDVPSGYYAICSKNLAEQGG